MITIMVLNCKTCSCLTFIKALIFNLAVYYSVENERPCTVVSNSDKLDRHESLVNQHHTQTNKLFPVNDWCLMVLSSVMNLKLYCSFIRQK